MDRYEKIKEMEIILDTYREKVDRMNEMLDSFEEYHHDYQKLMEYYGSQEYMDDINDANKGLIPSDIKCGVLSEDAVWDLIGDNYEVAIKMLEVATDMVRRR